MPVFIWTMVSSKQARNLLQARDVVVVVLDRGEGQDGDQLRQVDVRTVHLVDRHLPVLERRVVELLAQVAHHQRLVQRFLLGKAGRVDGFELVQKRSGHLQIAINLGLREVAQPIVEALVAEDGRELGVAL